MSNTLEAKDSNGNILKNGDKVNMTLIGLGSGVVEVILKDGELFLHDPSQGDYPVSDAVKRKDMILEKL